MSGAPGGRDLVLRAAPLAAYLALIWWLSSAPRTLPAGAELPHLDKLFHLVEYGALGLLAGRLLYPGLGSSRAHLRVACLAAVLLGAGWGALDELHQSFVPGREASLGDALADFLGSLGGASAYFAWRNRRGRRA